MLGYAEIVASYWLKMVGQTSMRTVTDYTFGVIRFLLMGAFVSASGRRELFRGNSSSVAGRARSGDDRGLRQPR